MGSAQCPLDYSLPQDEAEPVHWDLGGSGGAAGVRAVGEPEAAELVSDVSRGARGDDPGGRARGPGPGGAHPERAAEGGRRSRLSGEVQDTHAACKAARDLSAVVSRDRDSSRGPSGRMRFWPALFPGHRPSASALVWVLPARWVGFVRRSKYPALLSPGLKGTLLQTSPLSLPRWLHSVVALRGEI